MKRLAGAVAVVVPLLLGGCSEEPGAPSPGELRALWEGGEPLDAFYDDLARRRELWEANRARSEDVDPEMVERAREAVAEGGPWRILTVTTDGCSDSANVLPYAGELVERVEGLEMRIIGLAAGRPLMEAYPTPDGRPAVPTLLLLDEEHRVAGCFIERPADLVEELAALVGDVEAVYARKMAWYAEDEGRSTVADVVEMLEAAARGEGACRAADAAAS